MEQLLSSLPDDAQDGRLLVYTQSVRARIRLLPRGPDGLATEKTLDLINDSGFFDGRLSTQATNQRKLYDIYNQDPDSRVDVLAIALNEETLALPGDSSYLQTDLAQEAFWYDSAGERLTSIQLAVMVGLMAVETKENISTRLAISRVSLKT